MAMELPLIMVNAQGCDLCRTPSTRSGTVTTDIFETVPARPSMQYGR